MVDPQPLPTGAAVHWMEAAAIVVAMALGKVWDTRIAHPKVKKERNDELDVRLNSVRQAIQSSTQLIQQDVTTLSGEVKDLKAHVIGPDGQNGLRGDVRRIQTELADLAPRRRKR